MKCHMVKMKDMYMAAAIGSVNPKEAIKNVNDMFLSIETPETIEIPVHEPPSKEMQIKTLFTRWLHHIGKLGIKNPVFRDPEDGKDKLMKDMVLDAIKEYDCEEISLKHVGKVSTDWLIKFINQEKPDFKRFWGRG